jgi:hypothetical protein
VRIEFLENQSNVKQEIFEPFMALLMEALRLKDENQLPTPDTNELYKANDTGPKQHTAPVTLMEKQILSLLDHFPGVVEYSLYDRNFELRFSKSGQQQPLSNFHTEFLSDKLQKISTMLEAGAFKYMTINEKNGLRHVFLNLNDFSINAGLRREQSIDHFLQQLNASFGT